MIWALALVASASVASSSIAGTKAHRHHGQKQMVRARVNGAGQRGWYAREASKLPFGSTIWWQQMLDEGRLTPDTN
jgi:hypothetical protein